MKVIILAAGQGTRLRPLTDNCPKCMVEVSGKSIIERQVHVMHLCGIRNENITIVCGYRNDVLQKRFEGSGIHFIVNSQYETTNMVCSLMCAKSVMMQTDDILISYGDIIYDEEILESVLKSEEEASVVVDDDWYEYWSQRCENPLDDAETLMFDADDYLTEIGQKTTDLARVQSQYIGLMRFKNDGLKTMLALAAEAKRRGEAGEQLWRTGRNYSGMYMTDLLQGLIDEGEKLKAVHIHRGWFEVDDPGDLKLAESYLR